ncbi:unnamed protein product [Chrysoparadoxa australica]
MNNAIYLIPNYLATQANPNEISPAVKNILTSIDHFLVENVRTARRFISSLDLGIDISLLQFEVMDKNSSRQTISEVIKRWQEHKIGIISEAGLPGLADPGNLAVSLAHEFHRIVIPLPGASAIQTALICSGFDGQRFTFHGYPPIQEVNRIAFLKDIESTLYKTGYTQIFMETPFRNNQLMESVIKNLRKETLFSVVANLFNEQQYIKTQPIDQWTKTKVDLHKLPAVFCLGQYPK